MRLFSGVIPMLISVAALGGAAGGGAGGQVGGGISILPPIEIDRAIYEDGYLTVVGNTAEPNQKVILDGKYVATTNEDKEFRFHVRHVSPDCIITLSAKSESQLAVVRGCNVSDVPAAAAKPKANSAASAHGSSSVSQ